MTKKTVNAIQSSPKVSDYDAKMTKVRYSTGATGRAFPANVDKKGKGMGNPCGSKKR